jgi:hypothetical protein
MRAQILTTRAHRRSDRSGVSSDKRNIGEAGMAWYRRRLAGAKAQAGEIANVIATHAPTRSERVRAATIVSAAALLFSGYSMWETSLKQAELALYVTNTISYTRDISGGTEVREAGGQEVLVVPVTIANTGARDKAVVELHVDATNNASGTTVRFESAYTVDAAFFGARENPNTRRPRAPFAPLVISGRSAWSGTILFYPPELRKEKAVTPNSKVEVTLTTVSPEPRGWLDRLLGTPTPPVKLTLDAPPFAVQLLMTGEFTRLRYAAANP